MDRKAANLQIHRTVREISLEGAIDPMLESLNERRGVLLTSSYEYPGRYTRWDIGFVTHRCASNLRADAFAFTL